MTYLIASDISIGFSLYHAQTRSLKKALLGKVSSRFATDEKNRLSVQALKNISFSLKAGDRLGLVGANGSGKTTLLRTISGIYQPTKGSLSIEGKVISLLDPEQGMNTDLTGRENIWLRGYYLGLSKAQIVSLEQDIEEFTDIGHFMDMPVRSYSSGMVIRLAFGMATSLPPDIVLMDEWILAGDANFMGKARKRVEGMVAGADILVLASHSPSIMLEWTNRLIWLDNGEIRADGPPMDVFASYLPKEDFEALAAGHVVG